MKKQLEIKLITLSSTDRDTFNQVYHRFICRTRYLNNFLVDLDISNLPSILTAIHYNYELLLYDQHVYILTSSSIPPSFFKSSFLSVTSVALSACVGNFLPLFVSYEKRREKEDEISNNKYIYC